MKSKTINILGNKYKIIFNEELPELDGCCDPTIKTIKVCNSILKRKDNPTAKKDLNIYQNKVLRHELIHALFIESGLEFNTIHNEEVVDWIAYMYPKMKEIFTKLEIEV